MTFGKTTSAQPPATPKSDRITLIVLSLMCLGTVPVACVAWILADFVAQRSGENRTLVDLPFDVWLAAGILCPGLAWCILPKHRWTRLVVASLPIWPVALTIAFVMVAGALSAPMAMVGALFHR